MFESIFCFEYIAKKNTHTHTKEDDGQREILEGSIHQNSVRKGFLVDWITPFLSYFFPAKHFKIPAKVNIFYHVALECETACFRQASILFRKKKKSVIRELINFCTKMKKNPYSAEYHEWVSERFSEWITIQF